MSLPPPPEARDEVDDLYRQASAADPSRPAEAVRRHVLEHATQLAAERTNRRASASARVGALPQRASRWWRPAAMFGTLAAAAVAGLMIAPRFLMSPAAPTSRPPVVSAVQPESRDSHPAAGTTPPAPALEIAPFSREDKLAASPPALPEPAPARQERRETQIGAVAAASSPAAADASAATNTDMAAGLAQQVTVTGARRAAMAPPAANVTDAAAAFRHAAEDGDLRTLDRLLAGQSDINARDAEGRTPLMLAVLHGQTEVVSALLAYGADPNAADTGGTTPLEAARASGRPAIIAALQRYGARR